MADVFELIVEPNRRAIVDLLATAERPVGELVSELGLSQPSVSKHLRVLREGGLVECRVDGQRRIYRVRPEPLMVLDTWLAPHRQAWSQRLDALEAHLDDMDEES